MKSYNELLEGAKSLLKDATHTKSGLNSNHNNGNNSNVLIAAVIGLAAGAILGILLAPERGADTRNNISNSLNNLGSTVRDKARQGTDRLNDLKDKTVEAVRSKTGSASVEQGGQTGSSTA